MGKISQSDASIAAKKIVEPIWKKSTEIETELREYITELWEKTIPVDIMKLFKKNPEYIKTTSSVKIAGAGLTKYRSVSLIGSLPSSKGEYYVTLQLSNEQAKKAVKLVDAKSDMDDKAKNTKNEIENTILSLGTHKRVLEQLPEAYGMLPGINTNTQMVTQLAPTREKVRCLVSPEENKKCIDKI